MNPPCLAPLTEEVFFLSSLPVALLPSASVRQGSSVETATLAPQLLVVTKSPQLPGAHQVLQTFPTCTQPLKKRLKPDSTPISPSGCAPAVLSTPLLFANPGLLFFPVPAPPLGHHNHRHSTQDLIAPVATIVSILKHQQFKATSFPRWAPKALRVNQTGRN